MSIQSLISAVLDGYLPASREDFANHPVAKLLRNDLPTSIRGALLNHDGLVLKGSAGQGRWAKGPWIAVFNSVVTTSAQRGYYIVYLFREDMSGVYVSLNQGMTEAKQKYRSDAKSALAARAGHFRAILGKEANQYSEFEIDLRPDSKDNETAFYEAGNICAKFYERGSIPNDASIAEDLNGLVSLYTALVENDGTLENSDEADEPVQTHQEDATKFRLHKRIERNRSLAEEVKKQQGHACKVCGMNFLSVYGEIGKNFIEAHHLTPISAIKGQVATLDPIKDFAVLCSNCHRMIHRSGCVDDIEKFKRDHYHG